MMRPGEGKVFEDAFEDFVGEAGEVGEHDSAADWIVIMESVVRLTMPLLILVGRHDYIAC